MNREAWLETAVEELRPTFEHVGAPVPESVRVSCGWPSRSATSARARRIGECWSPESSEDKTHQVFISPSLADPVRVLDVLVHELVHASVGLSCGHKGPFRKVATKVGLAGQMTSTHAGDILKRVLEQIVARIGAYPHAKLDKLNRIKQTTRMLKATCPECGYVIRLTRQWADKGLPTCTECHEQFEMEEA